MAVVLQPLRSSSNTSQSGGLLTRAADSVDVANELFALMSQTAANIIVELPQKDDVCLLSLCRVQSCLHCMLV